MLATREDYPHMDANLSRASRSPSSSSRPRKEDARFELRYRSFSPLRCGYAFPCDANGRVDLDRVSERARGNYLYARAAVGFDLQQPEVVLV